MWNREKTEAVLERDALSNAGLLQVLRRGTAQMLRADENGILLRDTVSGICFLSESGGTADWLGEIPGNLLMVVGSAADADAAKTARNAAWMEPCDQYVWLGGYPGAPERLRIAEAAPEELEIVAAHYELISREELDQVAARHTLFVGHDDSGSLVGFAGSHLEGAMGILEVFPAFRRKGYAAELERYVIRHFVQNGLIPFGQVTADNAASAALQRKIGMTKAPRRAYWIGTDEMK